MNNRQGFEGLSLWLKKQGVERVRACMEATGTYGDELATYLYDAGHSSVLSILRGSKDLLRVSCFGPRMTKVDAGLIARFCVAMNPGAWTPLPRDPEITVSCEEADA